MQNLGTIDLILLDAPYVVPASVAVVTLGFDPASLRPAITYRPQEISQVLSRINSHVAGLSGLSTLALDPESVGGSPLGSVANVGGRDSFVIPTGGAFTYWFYTANHPAADGVSTAQVQAFKIHDRGQFDVLSPSPIGFSVNVNGNAAPGILYATTDSFINHAAIWTGAGLTFAAAFTNTVYNISQLWSGATMRQTPWGERNYCFMTAGTFRPDPVTFSYRMADGGAAVTFTTPVFPIASLQIAFANGDYTASSYYRGFIFVFDTNGAGPTGGRFEVVLCNPDMSVMALVSMTGGTPSAVTALKRPSAVQWSVKVDTDGRLYFSSGHAADITHLWISGPSEPKPNVVQNPFGLPCYTPCFPSVMEAR